jgi:hypothetical protein
MKVFPFLMFAYSDSFNPHPAVKLDERADLG